MGGLVNASRSVSMPTDAQSATTAEEWGRAIDTAVTAAQSDLMDAVRLN